MAKVTTDTQIDTINILSEASSAQNDDYILVQRGSISYKLKKDNLSWDINNLNDVLDSSDGASSLDTKLVTEKRIKDYIDNTETVPGLSSFESDGTFEWPENVQYAKVYVTGSGGTGGIRTAGSGATVIGYIKNNGNNINVTIGLAPTTKNTAGVESYIDIGGSILISAEGGSIGLTSASATISTNNIILSTTIIKGGMGYIDTNGSVAGVEESEGPASFWGSSPAYGASVGVDNNYLRGVSGNGFVMFEWF